jgi:hypothetical protein
MLFRAICKWPRVSLHPVSFFPLLMTVCACLDTCSPMFAAGMGLHLPRSFNNNLVCVTSRVHLATTSCAHVGSEFVMSSCMCAQRLRKGFTQCCRHKHVVILSSKSIIHISRRAAQLARSWISERCFKIPYHFI